MNKLVINSVKINSVNNQTLPLKEFSDGFNIVCGLNEAGKSTMMEFLKEALFAPRDYVGDIELTKSGTAYQVKIDGTKRNKAAKLKLLAPEDKTIEDVLDGFDRNFYQRAFTINLDDIKNIDSELFSLIQDHNAPALAAYKSKLENDLNIYLTPSFKQKKTLTDIVKAILDIDTRIRELSGKEEEYSRVTSGINTIEKDIENTDKLIKNKEQFLASVNFREEYAKLCEETESINKTFNPKLFENKQNFYELSKKTELITGYFDEINRLAASKMSQEIDEALGGIKLRYNIELSSEQAAGIDVSREIEEKVRDGISDIDRMQNNLTNLQDKKQDLIKNNKSIDEEINTLKSKAEKLQIKDVEEYESALNELKASISSLADISETGGRNKKDLYLAAGNIFAAVLLVILGGFLAITYVKSGLLVILAGLVITAFTVPIFFNKESGGKSSEIYDYVKNKIMPVLKRTEFLHTVSSLNQIVYECEGKLNEYKKLTVDIDNKSITLSTSCKDLEEVEEKVQILSKSIEDTVFALNAITVVNGKQLPPKGFIDFLEETRSLRELLTRLETDSARIEVLKGECDKYLADFSAFLTSAGLDSAVNPLSLREKVNEIQNVIETNDRLKNRIEDNNLRISEINQKLQSVPEDDKSSDKTLEELKEAHDDLINEKARLIHEKRDLEEFEGLVGLRNERNLLQNRLRDIINDLYAKKLALNIIEYAEKQQRSIEPNLMSAEKLLKKITDGKYISANFANRTITSIDGETKEENELSRGTKEQLYLAFRLGYALNYGNDGNKYRLPLIIDDAFVNFDKERLSQVLMALKEFAKTNQVLFFTCHKDYILSLAGDGVNVVDI